MNLCGSLNMEVGMKTMNSDPGSAYSRRWWILGATSLGALVIILAGSMVNIALPTLQREFNSSMSELQWIINGYLITFAGLMLLMGAVGDRFGHRALFVCGVLVFSGANIGAHFVAGATALIVWRAVMGVGASMILPATLAIITRVFPAEERGQAIGVWAGLNSIGIALGPIIGGALVDGFSWKAIFFVNIPVGVIAVIAGSVLIPRRSKTISGRLDLVGTILATTSVSAIVFGLIQSGDWGWSHPAVIACLCGGLAGSLLFMLVETRIANPLIDPSIFRDRRISSGIGAVFIMSLALVGITFLLSLFMQFVRGYTALQTGLRLLPLAGGILFGAGSADKLVKRFGTRGVMTSGFIGTAAVAAMLAFVQLETVYWLLGLAYFGLGFFLGYIAAPATDAIMAAAPADRSGVVSSTNTVARTIAGAFGVALLGALLSSVYSSEFIAGSNLIAELPAELVGPASESVGAAVIIADQLPGSTGTPLAELARTLSVEEDLDC
jgi:EmrB/QacA subfamily drug resistance transporter